MEEKKGFVKIEIIGYVDESGEKITEASVSGSTIDILAAYATLTESLINNGMPKSFLQAAFDTVMEEVESDKSKEDAAKELLSAVAKIFR